MSLYDKASLVMIPSGYKASSATLYSVVPNTSGGDFDVTVDADATRVNKDGLIESVAANQARLDYPLTDGVVGDCPNLLLEPSRTNLVLRSEELNTTWLTFRSSVTANDIVSPDGSQNAEKIIQQSGETSSGGVYQNLTLSSSTVYTYSVFLKSGGYDFGMIRIDGGQYAWFNLSSGTVGTITGSGSSSIQDFGNGWYRCSFTITTTSTTGQPHIYIANSDGSQTLSGADGVKGIYAWGAMVEQGSYPTSYIPTEGSSVTRSAETTNATVPSGIFGTSGGTIYVEGVVGAPDTSGQMPFTAGTDTSNLIYIWIQTNGSLVVESYTSTAQCGIYSSSGILSVGDSYKIAFGYANNDFVLYLNGTQIGTDTSGSIAIPANVKLGNYITSGYTSGKIKQVMIFNTRLSNTELQTLTS